MAKRGPKGKLTPEVRKKLEEAAALDCTIEEMCFYAGITKPTYYEWTKADPELSARLEELRNNPVLKARETIVRGLKSGDKSLATWYLERKRKKEFAERREVTGEDGKPLFDADTKAKADAAISGYLGNTGQGN
ncbi:hypothetical protein IVB45_02265 [Bradyrhizobium sp. 4]|uniref:Cro/CI family transcriptional regulator n=1 Tax=Bradyrhizobium sp. 4 TaxID=2782678 RepID=UPI001FFFB80C|nr:Cro/CI family transcriptional regulator [Bradyrhizobium sp. 4]UPJ35859.1 hypothetical protein IVB45_02265 [Bradyrhizobium sp. 4]